MIASIRAQNFQSWEDGTVHLHPGLNVFVGSGDSGKTSIASRAVRWAQENRIRAIGDKPMGDNYVSRWAKKTSAKGTVTLTADCSVTITRPGGSYCRRFREAAKDKSGKETNGYELNGSRFEAIGVGVPDAVSHWFNWSDVNVQKQHDQAFLISKGSGEVASFLNRTVKLDDIDAHITAAASLLRSEKGTLERMKEEQEADSRAMETLAWVDDAGKRLEALETLEAQIQALETSAKRIWELVHQMREAKIRMDKASKFLELEPRAKSLYREFDWCRGLQEKAHGIRGIVAKWGVEQASMSRARRLADLWPRVQGLRETHGTWIGEDVASGYVHSLVSRWSTASRVLEDSGKLAALWPRVQGLREALTSVQDARARLQGIRELVARWPVVQEVDWEDLEARARRMRALARGIESRESMVGGMQKYRLNCEALETSIVEAGKLVSELEAQRPETCPACGGTMHKERVHG